MKHKRLVLALSAFLFAVAPLSHADAVSIKPGETLQKQIDAHKGKKLTLRLQSGEELTGTVQTVTAELVHLRELAGKEYFDAIIDVNKITALIIRTK